MPDTQLSEADYEEALQVISPLTRQEKSEYVAQFTVEDLRAFAKQHDIDISGSRRKPDIVEDIVQSGVFDRAAEAARVKPGRERIPPSTKVQNMSDADLENQIRSWTVVPPLPRNHDFTRDELEQYLMLLHKQAETGGPYTAWNHFLDEEIEPVGDEEMTNGENSNGGAEGEAEENGAGASSEAQKPDSEGNEAGQGDDGYESGDPGGGDPHEVASGGGNPGTNDELADDLSEGGDLEFMTDPDAADDGSDGYERDRANNDPNRSEPIEEQGTRTGIRSGEEYNAAGETVDGGEPRYTEDEDEDAGKNDDDESLDSFFTDGEDEDEEGGDTDEEDDEDEEEVAVPVADPDNPTASASVPPNAGTNTPPSMEEVVGEHSEPTDPDNPQTTDGTDSIDEANMDQEIVESAVAHAEVEDEPQSKLSDDNPRKDDESDDEGDNS